MSNTKDRAVVILAAYDYESLQITLQSLEHSVDATEKIVVVLNGKRLNTASEKTERVARTWAAKDPLHRFAVRPLSSGKSALRALTETLQNFEPLENVRYICKVDDDLIPLKKNWVNTLADAYHSLSANKNMGFVTGLINNNCWGFAELINIYNKQPAYNDIANYATTSGIRGENKVEKHTIDTGMCGTVWNYPYMAWWIHQWTSLQTKSFIEKTAGLPLKQVPADTHYSIGCIFFEKALWLSLDPKKYKSIVDEELLHIVCKETGKEKWAVMSEPMIHLFYRTQRLANAALIKPLIRELATHFNDPAFLDIEPFADKDLESIEDKLEMIRSRVDYTYGKISKFSFFSKWKEKKKLKQYQH
jgi:hypothetical protein